MGPPFGGMTKGGMVGEKMARGMTEERLTMRVRPVFSRSPIYGYRRYDRFSLIYDDLIYLKSHIRCPDIFHLY